MPRETWNPEQKRGGGGRTLSATVGEIIIRKAIWISLRVALLSPHSIPEVGFDADWNQFDKVHCPTHSISRRRDEHYTQSDLVRPLGSTGD